MLIRRLKNLIAAIRKAMRLDIVDLNYAYSSEKLDALNVLPAFNLPKAGLGYRICSFLRQVAREFTTPSPPAASVPAEPILFFASSKNQRDSLWPICQQVERSVLVGYDAPVALTFPLKAAYALSLPFLPLVLLHYLQAKPYVRKSLQHFLHEYWLIYGFYIASRIWMQKIAPKAVVMANDHNYPNRTATMCARHLRIPTFYFQHASVTAAFPPLSFDFAMLEGMDAVHKYMEAGASSTKVFLVGMPKADRFFTCQNVHRRVQAVGICTNNLDPLEAVERLCGEIQATLAGLSLTLRPHPGDRDRWEEWVRLARNCGMKFSDSRVEVSFEFMKRVDAIIVGDSNILLESTLMNVYPLYYDFSATHLDYYGFLKWGLAEYHGCSPEICEKLRALRVNKPPVREKAKRYCHTVGTPHDGRSATLSADLVQALAEGCAANILRQWRRIPGIAFEVYEPINA